MPDIQLDLSDERSILLLQYDSLSEERRYFDGLLWQHLWRFFMINGLLLGIAYSEFATISIRVALLLISTVWAYISTIAFAKCYLWLRILTTTLEKLEVKLGMQQPPRKTEELSKVLGRRYRFLLPFQGISTPRTTFWALFLTSIALLILSMNAIVDLLVEHYAICLLYTSPSPRDRG